MELLSRIVPSPNELKGMTYAHISNLEYNIINLLVSIWEVMADAEKSAFVSELQQLHHFAKVEAERYSAPQNWEGHVLYGLYGWRVSVVACAIQKIQVKQVKIAKLGTKNENS